MFISLICSRLEKDEQGYICYLARKNSLVDPFKDEHQEQL